MSSETVSPLIASSSTPTSFNVKELTIAGSNFGSNIGDVRVYLIPENGKAPETFVIACSSSSITVSVSGMDSIHIGVLKAIVTVGGVPSSPAVVCNVAELFPEILSVNPVDGPIEGGVVVTITGNNLNYKNLFCRWGRIGLETPVKTSGPMQSSSGLVLCVTPKNQVGSSALTLVSEQGSKSFATGVSISFYPTMLISDMKNNRVLRFNAQTGEFIDVFVHEKSGGLDEPQGLAFGPDKNLYVVSSHTKNILQYEGSSGAFLKEFSKVTYVCYRRTSCPKP